ncbi:MAG TPA: alpha/beta fold hydrolase [Chitinophagaceae bacterium]|nr:alpha/beta fold hydrolase [Chitinophagaceae bacterium]
MILLFLAVCFASLFCQGQTVDSLFITTSDSVRLFVKRSGTGCPVLFVHGGPGSNSFYFEKEGGDVFSKIVQIIYLDQRGCGRSDSAMNGDYSLGRVVKDFDEVRQKLGYKQWIVMAHSFGGILATQYATNYLPTIKAMVYLNCTVNLPATAASGLARGVEILGNKPDDVKYFLNDSIPVLKRWGEIFGRLNEKNLVYKLMFDKKESKEYDDSLMALPFLKYVYARRLWSYPEYFDDFSLKTFQITVPVLVISGTRDYTIGVDHYKLMHFPDMEIKFVEGGHALYYEHNAELYGSASPFLKKYGR